MDHVIRSMQKYEAIGFDMDQTLVRYDPMELHRINFAITLKSLVENHPERYPRRLLEEKYKKGVIESGYIFDSRRGDVYVTDETGRYITHRKHGYTTKFTKLDIPEEIPKGLVLEEFKVPGHLYIVNTHFEFGTLAAFLLLVDYFDKGLINLESANPYPDMYRDFGQVMEENYSDSSTSPFYRLLRENLRKLIIREEKSRERLTKFLQRLKRRMPVVLITNSTQEYAALLMEYVLGKYWKGFFDLIVYDASKPRFFVDKSGAVSKKKFSRQVGSSEFVGGSVAEVLKKLKVHDPSKFLYVGDSLFGDVVAPKHVECGTVFLSHAMNKTSDGEYFRRLAAKYSDFQFFDIQCFAKSVLQEYEHPNSRGETGSRD